VRRTCLAMALTVMVAWGSTANAQDEGRGDLIVPTKEGSVQGFYTKGISECQSGRTL